MTILIFGGTGLIGTGTVAQLCADGEIVAVVARRKPDDGELLELAGQYIFHEGDITNTDFVSSVVNETKPTGIIHLAAFQKLQSLTLNYNRLTDASAEWLKGFKHLKFLNLKGNLISDDVKAKLIEAMPYTTVNT